ncbi:hypothetical protein [Ruegeria sp.]|uniref:hypothetical protein n=1 Tax=Ruegeria sp. TaxID=1879320 RepID=UPI00230A6902|nr:hypothetical protein [Ruegeria sp.]MDA7963377.1 hypothetical protein [Ruegeria sp.]
MRILLNTALAGCAACWIGMTPAMAETPVTYTDNGRALFSFAIPDFWTLRTGGPRDIEDTELGDPRAVARVMGIRPVTDETAWMGFVSPAGVGSIRGGVRYLQDIDKFLVKEPTVTSTSETRIGGLPARVIRGTGSRDGRGVNFTVAVVDLPRDRVAVIVAVLLSGANPDYVDDLNDVFASFRSAR